MDSWPASKDDYNTTVAAAVAETVVGAAWRQTGGPFVEPCALGLVVVAVAVVVEPVVVAAETGRFARDDDDGEIVAVAVVAVVVVVAAEA